VSWQTYHTAIVSFEFPASAVSDIVRSESDKSPHQLSVNFMGACAILGYDFITA